jgi:negative regulator of sigma E activity
MNLVSPEEFSNKSKQQQQQASSAKKPSKRRVMRKKKLQNTRDRWFLMRNAMREAEINRKALIRAIADIVQKILPSNTAATTPSHLIRSNPIKSEVQDFSPALLRPYKT